MFILGPIFISYVVHRFNQNSSYFAHFLTEKLSWQELVLPQVLCCAAAPCTELCGYAADKSLSYYMPD